MVHSVPELKVSQEEALTLGKEDETRLLRHRKLVLLVDLDQTLIHTTNENIQPNVKDVYHFQLYGPGSPWYHTRVRPFAKEFLEAVSPMYELHIVTFGARLYAHTIAGFLDPGNKHFSHRILSRDECFDSRSKTANLSSLFPCGDHMVCIIDDRKDVWNFAPNALHVKPYVFFRDTGDINDPAKFNNDKVGKKKEEEVKNKNVVVMSKKAEDQKEKAKEIDEVSDDLELSDDSDDSEEEEEETSKADKRKGDSVTKEKATPVTLEDDLQDPEDEDDYLHHLEDILRTVHRAYYELYDQNKDALPDVKTVIPYVRRKTLQGASLVLSGLDPMNVPPEKSKARAVARSLGAAVTEGVKKEGGGGGEAGVTTHVVAARAGTSKVNEAKRLGVRVVAPDWLWGCAERWQHVDERLYPLPKNEDGSGVTVKPPTHCVSWDLPEAKLSSASGGPSRRVSRSPSGDALPETLNPLLALSSEDLRGMEDELGSSDDSESSEDDQAAEVNSEPSLGTKRPAANDCESSDDDVLDSEEPKGWGRRSKRSKTDDEDEEDFERADDDDLEAMAQELERDFMNSA